MLLHLILFLWGFWWGWGMYIQVCWLLFDKSEMLSDFPLLGWVDKEVSIPCKQTPIWLSLFLCPTVDPTQDTATFGKKRELGRSGTYSIFCMSLQITHVIVSYNFQIAERDWPIHMYMYCFMYHSWPVDEYSIGPLFSLYPYFQSDHLTIYFLWHLKTHISVC